jgi:hypothetical protein
MQIIFPRCINSKTNIVDSNGELILDLAEPSVINDQARYGELFAVDIMQTDQSMQGRPDLVAIALYGYSEYIEQTLKFNSVTNPFRVSENDIFIAFDVTSMTERMRSSSTDKNRFDEIRKQYLTPGKESKQDPVLQKFNERLDTRQQPPTTRDGSLSLPPNLSQPGETELTVENGKIVFGSNVSKGQSTTSQPLSKSDFVAQLIKNRLISK